MGSKTGITGVDGFSTFAENYEAQTSIDALDRLFLEVVDKMFGYSMVNYFNLTGEEKKVYITHCGEWWQHYYQNGFCKVDPIFDFLPCASGPVDWQMCEEQSSGPGLRVMGEAKEAGLTNGLTPALRSPGAFHCISFAGRDDKPTMAEQAALNAVTQLYHEHRLQLSSQTDKPLLTPAELKYLRWIAEGKSARDTAQICGVSEVTVRKRLGAVYEKTGENGRVRAIVKLTGLGVIRPGWLRPSLRPANKRSDEKS